MSDTINQTTNETIVDVASRAINITYYVSGGALGFIPLAVLNGAIDNSPAVWALFASFAVTMIASARASHFISYIR